MLLIRVTNKSLDYLVGILNNLSLPFQAFIIFLLLLQISPMKDTFFSDARLGDLSSFGISTVLKLSACWYFRMPVGRAALHCEVLKRTAIKWYGFFREAVVIAEGHDFRMIGGQGDIVEVDESRPHKRKGRHGRLSSMQQQDAWIFGGISRKDGRR